MLFLDLLCILYVRERANTARGADVLYFLPSGHYTESEEIF